MLLCGVCVRVRRRRLRWYWIILSVGVALYFKMESFVVVVGFEKSNKDGGGWLWEKPIVLGGWLWE